MHSLIRASSTKLANKFTSSAVSRQMEVKQNDLFGVSSSALRHFFLETSRAAAKSRLRSAGVIWPRTFAN